MAKPLLYTTAAITAAGGLLYWANRPRTIPGSDPAVVPPPPSGDKFRPPRFPVVRSRAEQLARLRRSSGAEDAWSTSKGPSTTTESADQDAGAAEPYDILVIGGGATGSGIALDAVTRGLRVALVERDDFGSGTSSKSTKLVHGGVRYLEKAVWELDYNQWVTRRRHGAFFFTTMLISPERYKLVKEALRERKYFLDTAPHLSKWLPIMLPIDRWWKAPYVRCNPPVASLRPGADGARYYWGGTKLYDLLAGRENIESSYFLTKSKALDAFPMLKQDDLVGALVYYGE